MKTYSSCFVSVAAAPHPAPGANRCVSFGVEVTVQWKSQSEARFFPCFHGTGSTKHCSLSLEVQNTTPGYLITLIRLKHPSFALSLLLSALEILRCFQMYFKCVKNIFEEMICSGCFLACVSHCIHFQLELFVPPSTLPWGKAHLWNLIIPAYFLRMKDIFRSFHTTHVWNIILWWWVLVFLSFVVVGLRVPK